MAGKDKIFVFDLDGTLADTAPALLNAGNQVLKNIGRKPIKLEQYKGFIGGGTKKQVENLLISTGGIPDRGLDSCFKLFQDRYYADPVKGCSLYEGVLELLDLLKKKGVKSTICTQKFESSAKKVLLHLNIYRYFDGFAYGDSTGVLKPDPKVFYADEDPWVIPSDSSTTPRVATLRGEFTEIGFKPMLPYYCLLYTSPSPRDS